MLLLENDVLLSIVDAFFRYDLDASKHSEEDVRTLIRWFPAVLDQHPGIFDQLEGLPFRLVEELKVRPSSLY